MFIPFLAPQRFCYSPRSGNRRKINIIANFAPIFLSYFNFTKKYKLTPKVLYFRTQTTTHTDTKGIWGDN